MNSRDSSIRVLADKWRAHCEGHPESFIPLAGTPRSRKRLEQQEEQSIRDLVSCELPLAERAVAFRSILELRRCTARDIDAFFVVDAEIVVAGLSLLENQRGQQSRRGENAQAPHLSTSPQPERFSEMA